MADTGTEEVNSEEPIGDLPEAPEEKSLTARVFHARAVLLPLFSAALDFSNTKLDLENPVDLHDDTGKVIGTGVVEFSKVGGWNWNAPEIAANLFFDYQTPERLLVETGERPLYAIPKGEIDLGGDAINPEEFAPSEKITVKRIKVHAIHISQKPGKEWRQPIEPIAGPIEESEWSA